MGYDGGRSRNHHRPDSDRSAGSLLSVPYENHQIIVSKLPPPWLAAEKVHSPWHLQLFISDFPGCRNGRRLIAVFDAANESTYYTDFALRAFRIYLCMMVFACVNKGTFIYLQSLGQALASTLLSMVREVVFGVGFALLLPVFRGQDGVLYSMPVSDVLTFLISAAVILHPYKQLDA